MPDLRYGVFLRPDPATCWHITQVTFALERQFGLRSAGNFAPHATLVGNLAINVPVARLIDALDQAFDTIRVFDVYNHGLIRKRGLQYDINLTKDATDTNSSLAAVAHRVKKVVLPLSRPVSDYLVVPVADYQFAGHLGVASHEVILDDRMLDEVEEYVRELPVEQPPSSFPARHYTLYELTGDWNSHWWADMTWRHLKTWTVDDAWR